MMWGTALSFGILAAIMISMENFVGGNATFEFSYKTVLAFLIGGACGWGFWRGVFYLMNKNQRDGR